MDSFASEHQYIMRKLKRNFSKCNLINIKKGANGAIPLDVSPVPSSAFMSTLDPQMLWNLLFASESVIQMD